MSWAFAVRDFRVSLTYRFSFVTRLVGAAFTMAILAGLARLIGPDGGAATGAASRYLAAWGGAYLPYVLPGLIIAELTATALRLFAEKLHDAQAYGTLEAELNTPTPALWVVLCAPLYQLAAALARAGIYFVAGAWLFGHSYPGARLGWAVVAALLTTASYVVLGIASAAFTLTLKRGDPVSMVIGGLTLLTGGVLFPVEVLPAWVKPLSQLIPATHGLAALRGFLLGQPPSAQLGALLGLVGFVALGLPLAVAVFGVALRRARSDGSLGLY